MLRKIAGHSSGSLASSSSRAFSSASSPARSTSDASSSSLAERGVARLPERIIDRINGRQRLQRRPKTRNTANAGAEPAHVDVEVVELAAGEAARTSLTSMLTSLADHNCDRRRNGLRREPLHHRAAARLDDLVGAGDLTGAAAAGSHVQPWYLQKSNKKAHGS